MKKNRKQKTLLFLLVLHFFCLNAQARKYEVTSPDRRLIVLVMVEETDLYSVKYNEKILILPSEIFMTTGNKRVMGKNATITDTLRRCVRERILQAESGKSTVETRRNGQEWIIAAMNEWAPLDFTFSADFLSEGEYVMEEAADGINAEKNAHGYSLKSTKISAGEKVSIHPTPEGGCVAQIYKK